MWKSHAELIYERSGYEITAYFAYTIEGGILKDKVMAGFNLEPLLQLLYMRN